MEISCYILIFTPYLYLVQFSCSVMSDSLWPYELQHARPPCPSPTPGVHPNSCPLSQWCHLTISSSVVPFSSCLQSFPTRRSSDLRRQTQMLPGFPKKGPHSSPPSDSKTNLSRVPSKNLDQERTPKTSSAAPRGRCSPWAMPSPQRSRGSQSVAPAWVQRWAQ